LAPLARSACWDSCRRSASSAWQARAAVRIQAAGAASAEAARASRWTRASSPSISGVGRLAARLREMRGINVFMASPVLIEVGILQEQASEASHKANFPG
jgi:hypothetical protein